MKDDKTGRDPDDLQYWRERFASQVDRPREGGWEQDYGPAYRYGADASRDHPDARFEEVETHLERGWEKARNMSRLDWSDARIAAADAWQRARDLGNRKA